MEKLKNSSPTGIDAPETLRPLILTAHIGETHLEPFDALRRQHFPAARNFLRAHLTIFHRLPGEFLEDIKTRLAEIAGDTPPRIAVEVRGIRHLGAGVAFDLDAPELTQLRSGLTKHFGPWLGSQDAKAWRPHVTVQNKVTKAEADLLLSQLERDFQPRTIDVTGVDLWHYMGGPWKLERAFSFAAR